MRTITRGLTQVFYRYAPGALFDHDDYGICLIDRVDLDPSVGSEVDETTMFYAVGQALRAWDPSFREEFPDVRNEDNRRRSFAFGRPMRVVFRPYPAIVQCQSCRRVRQLRPQSTATTAAHCGVCSAVVNQMPYIQIHNCGRLEELFVPQQGCGIHGNRHMELYNPGRVRLAYWRCVECRREIQGLRMTPCSCRFSGQASKWYEKRMRVAATSDPIVHFTHTTSFVNMPKGQTARLSRPELIAQVLARAWGIAQEPILEPQATNSKDLSLTEMVLARLSKEQRDTILGSPELRAVQEQIEQRNKEANIEKRVWDLLSYEIVAESGIPLHRHVIEHVSLLETRRIIDLDDIKRWANERAEHEVADQVQETSEFLQNRLGISKVTAVDDFPIALCSYGFTRVSRDPTLAQIRPFHSLEDGRFPIYVHPTDTEALWFHLDPTRVAQWLAENGFANEPAPVDASQAWAWIYRQAPTLWLEDAGGATTSVISEAVEMLLHTISHILLKKIEWSGFKSASISEYLFPGTLSFVLFVDQHSGSKLGGLMTLFEHNLSTWLDNSLQTGRECIYDPLCSDEGGTCVGCLHREYGCSIFNRRLSRSVLFGGPILSPESLSDREIRHGYWQNGA